MDVSFTCGAFHHPLPHVGIPPTRIALSCSFPPTVMNMSLTNRAFHPLVIHFLVGIPSPISRKFLGITSSFHLPIVGHSTHSSSLAWASHPLALSIPHMNIDIPPTHCSSPPTLSGNLPTHSTVHPAWAVFSFNSPGHFMCLYQCRNAVAGWSSSPPASPTAIPTAKSVGITADFHTSHLRRL